MRSERESNCEKNSLRENELVISITLKTEFIYMGVGSVMIYSLTNLE